ncbi:O-antigen ligase [Phenylobacterium sp.]|uniref:O-antigen ligase family protein n=1 Tax=Phenylobacterium sp. TaxID=1871053 RepID=UPI0027303723|nr:O-antigen ligase family protein [Phenylobacterium sp.]MDP1618647.1 O-antigen ligase family protein [Phenylobacterium sp.]MDP1989076.1 O-antigen ligase family protein [Phenylobacterium sp.]
MTGQAWISGPGFARWCGWVLAFAAVLTGLVGWLGPLGFAVLLSIVGLLCLPAIRVTEVDRPAALALLVLMIWACGSMLWSPYRPEALWSSNAAKLISQAVLYWAAYSAVSRATPEGLGRAMVLFMWGVSALATMIIVEAVTGAALYQAVRQAIGDPIRPDLAVRNVAQGVFVLAVLWAPAALAAVRVGWWQLAVLMAAGIVAGAAGLKADAPIIALALASAAGAAVYHWPKLAPRGLAAGAAVFFLATPLIVWGLRAQGVYGQAQEMVSLSWSMRMDYWSYAVDWIGDKPLRGWGLDASRMFGPGIRLHPHNGALQIWLELGVIGAAAATVFWVAIFHRLERPQADLGAAAGAAAAVSYLTFAAVSFGVWQEWWLALGALAVVVTAAAQRLPARAPKPATALATRRASTSRPISE